MAHKPHSRSYITSILLFLYSLQGLVIGLFLDTFQVKIKKIASYVEVGTFLLCSYPFAFKFFWSPLVDTYSFSKLGRRKSWIIPVQLIAGLLIYYLGMNIEEYLENKRIVTMTVIAFIVMFLVATQDIAVDSWGLLLCGKDNCTLAFSCNNSGHLIGGFFSTFVFIHLNNLGYLSMSCYVKCIAIAFIVATFILLFIEEEKEDDDDNDNDSNKKDAESKIAIPPQKALKETLLQLKEMVLNPYFQKFIILLLMSGVGDIFSNSIVDLVYLENGMTENFYANLSTIFIGIRLGMTYLFSSIQSNYLTLFINSYIKMIYVYIIELGLLIYAVYTPNYGNGIISQGIFYCLFFLITLIKVYLYELCFSAVCGFFNKITDDQIGATYLTALNSANNLSYKWPSFFIFYLVDLIGFKAIGVLSILYAFMFYFMTKKAYYDLDQKDESVWKITLPIDKPKKKD